MSVKQDFELHVAIHMQDLKTLRNAVPSGLQAQFAEVSAVLATYDAEVAKIHNDKHLSAEGKAAKLKTVHDEAQAAVQKWQSGRTSGIEAQSAAQREKLESATNKLFPAPTDLQVQNMIARLSAFDPLEVEILYSDATEAERHVIEAAAEAIGRQPRRRGNEVVWEPLIAMERVAAMVAARIERANPDGAAALRDLQRIRGTYDALAGAAKGLLRDSLPGYAAGVPIG